jgi:hypothetical protein
MSNFWDSWTRPRQPCFGKRKPMTITATNLIAVAGGLLFLSTSPDLKAKFESDQAIRSVRAQAGSVRKLSEATSKAVLARSPVAMARVKGGCIPVVSGKVDQPLREGGLVQNIDKSPLGDGTQVCNGRGQTGVVSQFTAIAQDGSEVIQSEITDLATASTADLAEYRKLFNQLMHNLQPDQGQVPTSTIGANP